MYWLLPAVVAHGLNAVVFVVDKGILGVKDQPISQPLRYAIYSGLVTAGSGALLVFDFSWPTWWIVYWSLVAGLLWLLALWFFFLALKAGEPSRVVPTVGACVSLFTILLAALFLGEQLSLLQVIGALFLIGGGMLLALRWRTWRGLPLTVLAAVFAAGLAFAAHFAVTKFLYDSTDGFVAVFAYSRLAVGWWALLGWLALLLSARLFDGGQFLPRRQRLQARRRGYRLPIIFFMSKGVGAVALLLQNYAISLGSVSLVNALQGTQYVFLLLLAALISWHWPHLFHEELQRNTLGQKIAGISLVGIGLVFITL